MRTVTIGRNDADQKIEKFMGKFFKTMPTSLVHKFLRKKCVRVNKKHVKAGYVLSENDVVSFYIPDEFFLKKPAYQNDFKKAKVDFDILYEDENILLINKKAGIRMHDDEKHKVDTLISQVKKYLYDKGEFNPQSELVFSPAFCNRIDTNTGGIVIAAKNAGALRTMNEYIKNGFVHKYYLCVCEGIFQKKSDTLVGFWSKNEKTNKVTISENQVSDEKEVITKYSVLEEKNNMSILEINLKTGRSHQIRAHLSSVGHPICGDAKYGHGSDEFSHQALISYKLHFCFPDDSSILQNINGRTFQIPKVIFENGFAVERR